MSALLGDVEDGHVFVTDAWCATECMQICLETLLCCGIGDYSASFGTCFCLSYSSTWCTCIESKRGKAADVELIPGSCECPYLPALCSVFLVCFSSTSFEQLQVVFAPTFGWNRVFALVPRNERKIRFSCCFLHSFL